MTSAISEPTSLSLINIDLEKTILGTIIMEQAGLDDCRLVSDDFYNGNHQKMFAEIKKLSLADKPFDPVSLKSIGLEAKLIADIAHHAGLRPQLNDHISGLKHLAFRRRLHNVGQGVLMIAAEPDIESAAMLDRSLSLFTALEEQRTTKDEITGLELVEIFENNQIRRKAGELLGLSTGFSDLDEITHGLKGGQLIIVAGRPKMGKTILACNLSLAALDQNKAVVFASFELRADELADRFISMLSGVPLEKLEKGTDDDTQDAREKLYHDNLIVITGRSFGIAEFKARAKQIKNRLTKASKDLGLVVVDLITHIQAPNRERRELEVAFVSRELKVLAQELDIPIVAVSQLNRAVEYRNNPRPKISDLRESGSLEQDADKIILLYRPEYYLTQKPESERTDDEKARLKKVAGKCEMNVAAQRQGVNGIIYLQFDGRCTRFRPLTKTQQVQDAFDADIVTGEGVF